MNTVALRSCRGPHCQQETPPPDQERHRQMNLFLSRLDEAPRRWYVALESQRIGSGGDRQLAAITGLDAPTIRRGREELAAALTEVPGDRVRRPGGGRPLVAKKSRPS